MKPVLFLLFLFLFPCPIFSQDIELAGTDLNSNDILDWNVPAVSIPGPSAKMELIDSAIITSNFENEAYYAEITTVLKAAGFMTEAGVDYKKSGLKAHKTAHDVDYEIIVTYYPKIFRSATIPNKARVNVYASLARSALSAGDLKSLDKIKAEFAKQLRNSAKQAHALATTLKTNDEQRVVNQFSRRSLAAINFIDGFNTLQQVAEKANMLKEEVAQICGFLIEKGFVHVIKVAP